MKIKIKRKHTSGSFALLAGTSTPKQFTPCFCKQDWRSFIAACGRNKHAF